MEYPRCFGDIKNNKIKGYMKLGLSEELAKTMTHRICRKCRFFKLCCEKIISGNGFSSHKKGKKKKRDFIGYKYVGEKK